MAREPQPDARQFTGKLPELVVSPADLSRLVRELETIDSAINDRRLRKKGDSAQMLKASQLLDQTISLNKLNLLQKQDREQLAQFLQTVQTKAPVLHMSFSADPSAAFLSRLMVWLRQEIHPHVLLNVGLQPTIGAGCILRTTNKYFDFSLRQHFAKKRMLLLEQLIPDVRKAAT